MEELRNTENITGKLESILLKKDFSLNNFLLEIFSVKVSGLLFSKKYSVKVVEFLKSQKFLLFIRGERQKFLVKRASHQERELSYQEYYFYSFCWSILQISNSDFTSKGDFTFQGYYELVHEYLDYAFSSALQKEKEFIIGKLIN
jgi:hypothetical protein